MPYIGSSPPATALTASDITDGIISADKLATNSVSEVKMADDAISLTELKAGTDGEIISWDASGNPVAVGAGTSGHFLKSQGAGSQPVFAAAGGGKILQVVSGTTTTASASTSTSFVDSGLNVAITPAASSSKVLVLVNTSVYNDTNSEHGYLTLERQISGGSDTNIGTSTGFTTFGGQDGRGSYEVSIVTLDSPSTTSETTYEMQYKCTGGSSQQLSVNHHDSTATIVAIEVGA